MNILDQRLDLCKQNEEDTEVIRGQVVISLLSRDTHGGGSQNVTIGAGSDPPNDIFNTSTDLPEGWEARSTTTGRYYYVNHHTRSTQWQKPTAPASLTM